MNVVEIEGIGPERAERLARAGVTTTDELLAQGGPASGRRELAAATGFTVSEVLEWVNRADLARISGVGTEYADLLEAAGVDSPAELAQRNPANLAAKLRSVSDASPDTIRRVPGEGQVALWTESAKGLPRMVWHGTDGPDGAEPVAAASPPPAPPTERMRPEMAAMAEAPKMAEATAMPGAGVTADSPAMADAEPAMAAKAATPSASAPALPVQSAPVKVAATTAPARPSVSATPAGRSSSAPAPTHGREGLWHRIRRALGMK